MRINIELNTNSIKNAINEINNLKKKLSEAKKIYLIRCAEWIRDKANENLNGIQIGSSVKSLIQSSWHIDSYLNSENDKIILYNTAKLEEGKNLAVFVEFGVGIVGESAKHAEADSAGYKYNVPSAYKLKTGAWIFKTNSTENISIPDNNYHILRLDKNNDLIVYTKGSNAALFLYKAMKLFETSEAYKKIWKEVKAEIIR